MDLKMIRTLYSNKKSSVFRNQNLINMLIIGIKLKFGEFFGSIYINQKTVNSGMPFMSIVAMKSVCTVSFRKKALSLPFQ